MATRFRIHDGLSTLSVKYKSLFCPPIPRENLLICMKLIDLIHKRLPQTSQFFVVELQIFCRGQIRLKFVGTSTCRTLADFLSWLTAFRLGAESSKSRWRYLAKIENCFVGKDAMLERTLVHVTLRTIPHWLRFVQAPTNCLGPLHTSWQSLKRRFEI